MGVGRRATIASTLILSLAILALLPDTVLAGGLNDHRKNGKNPSAGYPAPIPMVYPFAGLNVDPIDPACCYTVPIVAVYQCPAVLTGQRGSAVVYTRSDPMFGLLGGQPYLYHH